MDWELIDTVSFFSFTLIFYFLSMLSKRLGEVMGMKKYYYLYYVGMVFALLGSVFMAQLLDIENSILIGYIFFSIGLTCALIASIIYWGWLFRELAKG